MDAYVRGFNPAVNATLRPFSKSPGSSALKLLLVLYGGTVAPKLPAYILKWFNYVPFKLLVIFLIVWTSNHDPAIALALTFAFYATFNILNDKAPFEPFTPGETLAEGQTHEQQ